MARWQAGAACGIERAVRKVQAHSIGRSGRCLGICAACWTVVLAGSVSLAMPHEATTESAAPASGVEWRGPNLAIPVRADSSTWEDVGQAAGYRVQHHRRLGYYRLLDGANARLGWGSRDYCEDLLACQLEAPAETHRRFNVEIPTLGGLQFWGDEMVYCGWRIQRNVLYGHHRLLDPGNVRRAWGTYEECEEAFRSLVDPQLVRPRSVEFVILLHGLFRSRNSFKRLERYLAEQGYEVVAIKYPSTQTSIEDQAAQLARVIGRLEGADKIHFVTHSLGGLIVRCYLRDHRDPRVGRLVMIAPPNRGALMAKMAADWFPYRILTGPAGQELIGGSGSLIAALPAPWCEFGVIAGGRGNDRGYSPLIPGDDDGSVGVGETRLEGMRDSLIVPAIHAFIADNERVKRAVVQFLRTGRFGEDASAGPPTTDPGRITSARKSP